MMETYLNGGIKHVYFTKRYRLWAPERSLSTHMVAKYLPNGFNWEVEFNDLGKLIDLPPIRINKGISPFTGKQM